MDAGATLVPCIGMQCNGALAYNNLSAMIKGMLALMTGAIELHAGAAK